MIESPLIQRIVEEKERTAVAKATLNLLNRRLGVPGPQIEAGLGQVTDEQAQLRLNFCAATCTSLQAFEDALREELPKPPPASTRGRRRKKAE